MKSHVYEGLTEAFVEEYDASLLDWLNYDVRPKPLLDKPRDITEFVPDETLFARDDLDWENDYVIKPTIFRWKPITHYSDYIPRESLFARDDLDWENDYVIKPVVFRRKPITHYDDYIPRESLFARDDLDWENDFIIKPILPGWGYKVIFDHFYGKLNLEYPKCVSSYMTKFPPPSGGRL